jgi:hypothetical protein
MRTKPLRVVKKARMKLGNSSNMGVQGIYEDINNPLGNYSYIMFIRI